MAFSSLNTVASSSGLGVASAPNNTTTTYSSGLYYKGYTGNDPGDTYFYGVSGTLAYYNNGIFAFSDSNTSKAEVVSSTTTNITSSNISTFTNNYIDNTIVTFYGYFKPNESGSWSFRMATSNYANDEISILWIGSDGQTIANLKSSATAPTSASTRTNTTPSYTGSNANKIVNYSFATNSTANVNSFTIYTVTLTSGKYYPILMNWGQSGGGEYCELAIKRPSGTTYSTDGSSYYFNTGA